MIQTTLCDAVDAAKRIFEAAGLKGERLAAALDNVFMNYTNESALAMGDVEIADFHLFTPVEIGAHFSVSPKVVNRLLADAGYQRKVDGKWEAVGPGAALAVIVDETKLYWKDGIFDVVERLLND